MENFKFTATKDWLKEYASKRLFTTLTEEFSFNDDVLIISYEKEKNILKVESNYRQTNVTFEDSSARFLEEILNLYQIHDEYIDI